MVGNVIPILDLYNMHEEAFCSPNIFQRLKKRRERKRHLIIQPMNWCNKN